MKSLFFNKGDIIQGGGCKPYEVEQAESGNLILKCGNKRVSFVFEEIEFIKEFKENAKEMFLSFLEEELADK